MEKKKNVLNHCKNECTCNAEPSPQVCLGKKEWLLTRK